MSDFPEDSLNSDDINPHSFRWIRATAWIVALVVFEMTADPSMVVVVGCTKFGWEQLRAARWLRRTDPDPRRGRACRWFYVSWGLWRISIVATLMMFVVAFLFAILRANLGPAPKRPNEPPIQFVVAFSVALIGFALSTLTTFFGVVAAWRTRTRVWVGRAGVEAYRNRRWPPTSLDGDRNRLGGLLVTAVPLALVGGIFPPVAIVVAIASNAARIFGGNGAAAVTFFVGATVMMIGGLIGLMVLTDAARYRMRCASPAECWGHQVPTPPPSNQRTFGSALR